VGDSNSVFVLVSCGLAIPLAGLYTFVFHCNFFYCGLVSEINLMDGRVDGCILETFPRPRPHAKCIENSAKFGRVVFEIRSRTDIRTYKHADSNTNSTRTAGAK